MMPGVEREPELSRIMAAAAKSMRAEFERTEVIQHRPSKGTARENAILESYLRSYLPGTVRCEQNGEIITTEGERSGQCDILIFDPTTPPLYEQSTYRLVPAECVYGVIEVKSRLTGPELRLACDGIARAKRLPKSAFWNPRPSGRYRTMYGRRWDYAPISGFIFAYDSIGLDRLAEVFLEVTDGQPLEERVDGIWILGKGILQWVDPTTGNVDPGARPGAQLGTMKTLDKQDVLLSMTLAMSIHFTDAWMPGTLDLGKYAGPIAQRYKLYTHEPAASTRED